MNKIKDKIPKNWGVRKGCFWCRGPLLTMKEKVLRTCNVCAQKSLDGFDDIAHGKLKQGKDKVMDAVWHNPTDRAVMDKKVDIVMNKKQKRIVKEAKKKGISEEEALEAIKQLKA